MSEEEVKEPDVNELTARTMCAVLHGVAVNADGTVVVVFPPKVETLERVLGSIEKSEPCPWCGKNPCEDKRP